MEKFTEEEFNKIGHTLGIKTYNAKLSRRKSDKALPDKFYRNYYNYGTLDKNGVEPEWITAISKYIDKWVQHKQLYFQINELGISLFREQFKEDITEKHVPLSKSKQRYQDYLDADPDVSFAQFLGIKPKHKYSHS